MTLPEALKSGDARKVLEAVCEDLEREARMADPSFMRERFAAQILRNKIAEYRAILKEME